MPSSDGSVPLWTLIMSSTGDFPIGLLIAIIVLILMSGFFSSTETAYSCANRIKLRTLVANGDKKAKKVLDLAEDKYDKLISTILIGNNIVNLTASTLATLLFAQIIADANTSAVVSTAVTTLAVLIFGEITPKFIAKVYPERLSMAYYPIIKFFYYAIYLIFNGFIVFASNIVSFGIALIKIYPVFFTFFKFTRRNLLYDFSYKRITTILVPVFLKSFRMVTMSQAV